MKNSFQACVVFLLLIWAFNPSFSQTKILAHKSHSGQKHSFSTDSNDGFGLPSKRLDRIEKINDSTVVMFYAEDFWLNDTLFHHPILKKKVSSLQKMYGDRVELVGFEKKDTSRKHKAIKED